MAQTVNSITEITAKTFPSPTGHRVVPISVLCSPHPDTNETMDARLVHHVECLFTTQLLPVLMFLTRRYGQVELTSAADYIPRMCKYDSNPQNIHERSPIPVLTGPNKEQQCITTKTPVTNCMSHLMCFERVEYKIVMYSKPASLPATSIATHPQVSTDN